MSRRLWTLLLVGTLALPLILLTVLIAAAATETGTRSILQAVSAAARSNEMTLVVRHASGSLFDRLILRDLEFRNGDMVISAGRLELAWRPRALLSRHIAVQRLAAAHVAVVMPPAAPTEPASPEIPDIALPVRVTVDELRAEHIRLSQGDLVQQIDLIDLALEADQATLQIELASLRAPQGHLTGGLKLEPAAPHRLRADLTLIADEGLAGSTVGEIESRIVVDGPALRPSLQVELRRPARADLTGDLRLDQVVPRFALTVAWPGLRWPLSGPADFTADAGKLEAEGTIDNYRLNLTTSITGEDWPAAGVRAKAFGNTQGMTFEPLAIDVEDAALLATGELRWQPDLAWNLDIAVEHLDPGLFQTEWPGRLDGELQLAGSLDAEGQVSLDVATTRISGVLRDQPVRASGALALRGDRWRATDISVESGPNKLVLDGSLGERIEAAVRLSAPDLAAAYPGLAGAVTGSAQISGTREKPSVQADLEGGQLRFAETSVESLDLTVDWRSTGGETQLTIDRLKHGTQLISHVEATLSGSPENHRLQLAANAEAMALDLAARGRYAEDAWRGAIERLRLVQDTIGSWELSDPTPLSVDAEGGTIDAWCLEQTPTSLCGSGEWRYDGPIDLVATLERLSLGDLVRRLSEGLEVDGELAGQLKVGGTLQDPTASIELRSDAGALQVDDPDLADIMRYRAFELTGTYTNDLAQAGLGFELGEDGKAVGALTLAPAGQGDRTLNGELTATLPDLGLVAELIPALEETRGRLSAALELGGTLSSPTITGRILVDDAEAQVPDAGIHLDAIRFEVSGDAAGGPIDVSGVATSGDGTLELGGTVTWSAGTEPAFDLRLSGDDFLVSDLELAVVRLSPDLSLQGSAMPYTLSGELHIPSAQLAVEEIPPSVVRPSEDEVIVGAPEPERPVPTGRFVRASVLVTLGDDVTFDGFGLTTQLAGRVNATVNDQGPRIDGKIQLRDGRFEAYGQDLAIERGDLLFAGPADNPNVDLRAARISNDRSVTAYLELKGQLRTPQLRVYTKPALADSEALAYLLTGRGLANADDNQQFGIATAAVDLGLAAGDPVLQDLGNQLGLDQLSVEGGDAGLEDSSLILGKYLNPDLYLGYTQGLFQPEGAVLLRLRVTEQIEVETRSGAEQSVDVLYRIEHD